MSNKHSNSDIDNGRSVVMQPRDLPADHPDANRARDLYVRQGVESVQHGDMPPAPTADTPAAADPMAELRASARQARALIDTLAQSTRGTQLRLDGQPRPLLWGIASARDLVAVLVKLASDTSDTTDKGIEQ
jgi:hypothetical protein